MQGSPAYNDGSLRVGDKLLAVDDVNVQVILQHRTTPKGCKLLPGIRDSCEPCETSVGLHQGTGDASRLGVCHDQRSGGDRVEADDDAQWCSLGCEPDSRPGPELRAAVTAVGATATAAPGLVPASQLSTTTHAQIRA